MLAYLLGFGWITRDHGLVGLGVLVCALIVLVFQRWEKIGWSAGFAALGAGLMALVAHFLHWWR